MHLVAFFSSGGPSFGTYSLLGRMKNTLKQLHLILSHFTVCLVCETQVNKARELQQKARSLSISKCKCSICYKDMLHSSSNNNVEMGPNFLMELPIGLLALILF